MDQKLPVKIRADIRDKFDASDRPLQKTLKSLAETIGYEVMLQIEWPMFWTSLESHFPEKELFIPYVVTVVSSWAQRLNERLEDDKNEAWTEQLLEKLEKRRKVLVKFDVGSVDRPSVTFDKNLTFFTLTFPLKASLSATIVASGLYEDLEDLLNEKSTLRKPSGNRESNAPLTTRPKEEGWDEVVPASSSAPISKPRIDVLPTIDSLARPEQLFRETVPYTMTLQALNSSIVIRGTHQPSLELLANYFTRYAKIDQQDTRRVPLVKVELRQSHFGMGIMYDSVQVEPFKEMRRSWIEVNEALFITFIEGVLGYELVTTNGHAFVYKRTTPFRSG